MKLASVLLGSALAVALSPGVFAQSPDTKYCTALGASYDKYVLTSGSRGSRGTANADVDQAKSKCASDPASAIPVLEKTLKDAKVNLPPRS